MVPSAMGSEGQRHHPISQPVNSEMSAKGFRDTRPSCVLMLWPVLLPRTLKLRAFSLHRASVLSELLGFRVLSSPWKGSCLLTLHACSHSSIQAVSDSQKAHVTCTSCSFTRSVTLQPLGCVLLSSSRQQNFVDRDVSESLCVDRTYSTLLIKITL
jgi:hypothetical protein